MQKVFYVPAALSLLLLASASAQRIEITSLPSYGKQGWIRGRVTQVDPSRVSIIVFSRVKGFSIQPGCAKTTVEPDASGLFSIRISEATTATHYVALLVPRGFVPLCHSNEPRIPGYIEAQVIASDFRIRPQPGEKVIHWSGFEFTVREWTGGPGDCIYDKRNARVDREGRLHLSVRRRKGVYTCAEVVLTRSLGGYGAYRISVASNLDALSPAVVFGAFTYASFSSHLANREIDFTEISRWGDANGPLYAQFVVQPADADGNFHRFPLAPAARSVFETVWRPDGITFRSLAEEWQHAGALRPLDQTVHLNLWTYQQPAKDSEIILQKFEFDPASGGAVK